jgi:hypothetical protein
MTTQATQISGAAFFKHKYLTNPSITPEDLVIAVAENLTQALETSTPQHLRVSTIQALKDLSEVFTDSALKYSNDPAFHMPDAPPKHPHQEPTTLGTSPSRVHPTMVSTKVPGILPTCAPSSVQEFLFPLEVSSVGPRQNIAVHQLGTEHRFPKNSNISQIGTPTPAAPISRRIKPHEPSSPLTKLR